MLRRNARFTVFQLMAATVVTAVFCVALFNDNQWWRATLGTVTMILNSLLAAIFTTGERRAFSLSFFVGALFFLVGLQTYMFSLPYLLTIKAYEIIEAYASSPPNDQNFLIVASIFWLQLTCFSAAYIGRVWYRKTLAEKASQT